MNTFTPPQRGQALLIPDSWDSVIWGATDRFLTAPAGEHGVIDWRSTTSVDTTSLTTSVRKTLDSLFDAVLMHQVSPLADPATDSAATTPPPPATWCEGSRDRDNFCSECARYDVRGALAGPWHNPHCSMYYDDLEPLLPAVGVPIALIPRSEVVLWPFKDVGFGYTHRHPSGPIWWSKATEIDYGWDQDETEADQRLAAQNGLTALMNTTPREGN
jgi:hypothetical protein